MLKKVRALLRKVAPQIEESLLPPATRTQIEELRSLVPHAIPCELIELYEDAAGNDPAKLANFAYGFVFRDISSLIKQLADGTIKEIANQFSFTDPGIKMDLISDRSRLEIGHDGSHCKICIDLDPAIGGSIGQVIFIDTEFDVALVLARSVREYITNFEIQLAAGQYSLQDDALRDGVQWLHPDRPIDVGNWYNSPTWQYAKLKN